RSRTCVPRAPATSPHSRSASSQCAGSRGNSSARKTDPGPSRPERLEPGEPVHRLDRCGSLGRRTRRGRPGGPRAARRGRSRGRRLHLGAEARDPLELPSTESLAGTLSRVLPLWHARIAPELRSGASVLVVAHGNSLRAMVKMLDRIPEREIVELNIPTGVPLLYELDAELKPLGSRYLGDPQAVAAAAEAVKRQTEKR